MGAYVASSSGAVGSGRWQRLGRGPPDGTVLTRPQAGERTRGRAEPRRSSQRGAWVARGVFSQRQPGTAWRRAIRSGGMSPAS